jgi:hypothetical protein
MPTYRETRIKLRDLIEHVGEPLFEEARRWAWETAARTATGAGSWPNKLGDVPLELQDVIWALPNAAWVDRVALAFELYRTMPCYANLMYIQHQHDEWDADARRLFWQEYRSLVSEADDRLAEPVAYSLWCDYFEDPGKVEEAWQEIARPQELSEQGLERVLDSAGPVPFRLKVSLYQQLAADRRWHQPIFRSLLHSGFDYYGELDVAAARSLLPRLDVASDTPGLDDLKRRLELAP